MSFFQHTKFTMRWRLEGHLDFKLLLIGGNFEFIPITFKVTWVKKGYWGLIRKEKLPKERFGFISWGKSCG